MALAKRSLIAITTWLWMLASLGAGETMTGYSVDVVVQSVPAKYGDTMVAIPIYLQNNGFDSISGYDVYFTSGIPDLIDFVDVIDTVGSLSSKFCYYSIICTPDTCQTGDEIHIRAFNGQLDTTCSDPDDFILPQTSGLLFTLHVNVAKDCNYISDSNSVLLQIVPVITNFSDKDGSTIPDSTTSADTLILSNGFVDVPGSLVVGDVNGSCGGIPCSPTLADIIHLVNYIFNKPPQGAWAPCPMAAADANCSGGTPSLADVITIVNYIFKGQPFPCP